MKLTAILLLAAVLQVSARSTAQTVTYTATSAPLSKVLSAIEKQTGYNIFYDADDLRDKAPVTVLLKAVPLREALEKVLESQSLKFDIQGNTVFITKMEAPSPTPALPPVDVHGIVYNEGGQPMSGANVTIKATGKGTITNAKGEFRLTGIPDNSTLVISFIGYVPQKVKVTAGDDLQVYLVVAKNELDKVVIQGYGTTTQRLATGSIVTVTAAEIERQPVMNPLEALQGKVPGLVVTQTSGYASAPFKVELRGRSVLNPSLPSEPLYIIDGVPLTVLTTGGTNSYATGSQGFLQNGFIGPANGQSPLFSINPEDIESITVLKDADATAIYGSRGALGVIIINTKKGKVGKTQFKINAYEGMSEVTNHYSMLNTKQYLQVRREAFRYDNIAMTTGNAYDLLVWDTTRNTDWQKYLWGNKGRTTDVQLDLSGGNKQGTFRLGADYHRQTGILTHSGADQRASLQFNFTHRSLDQRLNLSFTNSFAYTQSDIIGNSATSTLPPDAPPIFDSKGNLNWAGWNPVPTQLNFASSLLSVYTAKTAFLNSRLNLEYELFKGLTFSTSLGYSNYHNTQFEATPIKSLNPATNPTGSARFGNNNGANWIVEPQLEYKRSISKGKLTLLLGGSNQSVSQQGNLIVGTGYVNDNLLGSASNAPVTLATDANGQYKYAAGFARINYNWDDKYLLNATARRDGSSRFGPGRQFGNFGSVGAAWIFTEENWGRDLVPGLSFGKLRGSYGTTGSDLIGDYNYLTRWSASGQAPYEGAPSYLPLQHANPDLEWQVDHKLEAALDLGFLKDRINIEIIRYRNRIGNQLITENLPGLTGFTSVTANFPGVVQNAGWEGQLKAKLIDNKNFSWSVNFNIGLNKNKLLSYPGLASSPFAGTYVIGQPLNIARVLHFMGVDPQTGQYTFQDRDHDGQIRYTTSTANDLYNKDVSVTCEGGFGTDLQYKGFQVNVFFAFRGQVERAAIYSGIAGTIGNVSTKWLDHWQKPGDIKPYAVFTTQGKASNLEFSNSDGVYSNGSYVRLKNLSLSYDLPGNWTKKAGIQGCRIYARGQNLFLITKYNGVDPDASTFGSLPPAKIFTGGIQFNF
ncbi:MAG TPA: SusC/RagA family TonB-linked outer membrane protein [Puia sp.]|jgi:TonB-linked SusC/RagA family outer membrane protein